LHSGLGEVQRSPSAKKYRRCRFFHYAEKAWSTQGTQYWPAQKIDGKLQPDAMHPDVPRRRRQVEKTAGLQITEF
jgi:hypothetical protein